MPRVADKASLVGMEMIITVRKDLPNRERSIAKVEQMLKAAGVVDFYVLEKMRTAVAAFRTTTPAAAIFIEPKDPQKLSERIRQAMSAREEASRDLARIHEEAGELPGARHVERRLRPLPSPTFIVIAKDRVPSKTLPSGTLSFEFSEEERIVAAVRELAAKAKR